MKDLTPRPFDLGKFDANPTLGVARSSATNPALEITETDFLTVGPSFARNLLYRTLVVKHHKVTSDERNRAWRSWDSQRLSLSFDRGPIFAVVTNVKRLSSVVLALIAVAATSALVTWSLTRVSETSPRGANVPVCIQGQLQVAIEQGGGLAGTVPETYGYTFLVVNAGAQSCALRGYPYEVLFSTQDGHVLQVSISHERTVLYAQPKPRRVVLRPGGVASFGISYRYKVAPPGGDATTCLAALIDVRLPARASQKFSYEFPVRMDVCEAGRRVEVTPVEARSAPQVLRSITG